MHKVLLLTTDLGGKNLLDLLQRSGGDLSDYQLPQSHFYIAKKIRENKAMIQLQNEIYTNRKVAASA